MINIDNNNKIVKILRRLKIDYFWRLFLKPYRKFVEKSLYIRNFWYKKWLYYYNILRNKEWIIEIQLKNIKHPIFLRWATSDKDVFRQIFLNDEYNYKVKTNPKSIIDCWANNWLTAIYFANKYPDSKIVAVEPENSNFEILSRNIEKYENIYAIKKWIWDKNTNLVITNPDWNKWSFQLTETNENEWINAITINQIMKDYNITEISILKIDIEWSEKRIFENNSDNWLKNTNYIFVETHERYVKWCNKIIKDKAKEYWFWLDQKWENLILKK